MKKIVLFGLLALGACAPQMSQQQFAQICVICMAKANITEGALRHCPRHVKIKGEREQTAYTVFRNMSKTIHKADHEKAVLASVKDLKASGCQDLVSRIQAGNTLYEFMAVK